MSGYPVLGAAFGLLIATMIAVEILVSSRRKSGLSLREAALWVALWAALAAAFGAALWLLHGREKSLQFATGYVLEQSLSVDNMFVFILIFRYFGLPRDHQARVLRWGIIGAIAMRLAFIAAGVELIRRLSWMTFVFGGVLVYTAAKLAFESGEHVDPARNPALRALKRLLPVLERDRGRAFFAKVEGVWHATPLLAALLVVEFSDVVFAVDSIPAVIAITPDPFIVYTSNVFAIMGLRALYFLLSGALGGLAYLKTGLSIVLAFVGLKMIADPWLHVPTWTSLLVVAGVVGASVAASLLAPSARSTRA